MAECNRKFGRAALGFTEETLLYFSSYDWPGNVRELRNVVEACFVHLPFARMRFLELPTEYRTQLAEAQERFASELDRLLSTLDATNWNISKTARTLRWSRMTLYRKLAKYHLVKRSSAAGGSGT
jgi:transcriptional regulator of acetoin/glycerol metabolism